ncbi:MAG: DUF1178 family protein [Acetobacteraceae bacterium]
MIFFKLRCAQAHEFDGWFQSATSFAEQGAAQLVACPHCGTTHVDEALMALAIAKQNSSDSDASLPRTSSPSRSIPMSDHLRVALRQLRRVVDDHCENVGSRFAAETIKRHESAAKRETIPKGIYGQASSQERDILEEKGIEFVSIPWGQIDDA